MPRLRAVKRSFAGNRAGIEARAAVAVEHSTRRSRMRVSVWPRIASRTIGSSFHGQGEPVRVFESPRNPARTAACRATGLVHPAWAPHGKPHWILDLWTTHDIQAGFDSLKVRSPSGRRSGRGIVSRHFHRFDPLPALSRCKKGAKTVPLGGREELIPEVRGRLERCPKLQINYYVLIDRRS